MEDARKTAQFFTQLEQLSVKVRDLEDAKSLQPAIPVARPVTPVKSNSSEPNLAQSIDALMKTLTDVTTVANRRMDKFELSLKTQAAKSLELQGMIKTKSTEKQSS